MCCFRIKVLSGGIPILFLAFYFFAISFFPGTGFAQSAVNPSHASQIKLAMQKLNFLGSVLYLAAHPDDENTRLIVSLSKGRLAFTGYLSITRGDGGQNLIGSETRESLGMIRTQELLAARRIDGGKQFFTRAIDFGYSKDADEAFRIWGKRQILSDVVRVIREVQPDIIITRFPPGARAGHGHHTASAILAEEAFSLANDPGSFPDQVVRLGLWQPMSLYTNTGRWWHPDIDVTTPGVIVMDVGGYAPLLGMSYSEIAAKSRTQHKSQGFGAKGRRGEFFEFLEYRAGHQARHDIFEPVNTTWLRLKGGEHVQPLVTQLIDEFDETNPAASVASLLALREAVLALDDGVWKRRKIKDINQLIRDCLGLYVSITSDRYYVAPGESLTCKVEAVNRSKVSVSVRKMSSKAFSFDSVFTDKLMFNKPLFFSIQKKLSPELPYSNPYWLKEKHDLGSFFMPDKALIGKPDNDAAVIFNVELVVAGKSVVVHVPLIYSWVDPVAGELFRPVDIVPPLSVQLSEPVVVFSNARSRLVDVLLKSYCGANMKGKLTLALPPGWRSEPLYLPFDLAGGDEKRLTFKVYSTDKEMVASLRAVAEVKGHTYSRYVQVIDYDHIPTRVRIVEATAKAVRIALKTRGKKIGYIMGAGDKIPEALHSMGYTVEVLDNDMITLDRLQGLDAVVLGIRTFNVNERIPFFMKVLLNYVHEGGVLLVQYNTSRGLKLAADALSPYPLSLSRLRVTDENSPVRFVLPNHPVLHAPNRITHQDFNGWQQERGLYFPNSWDEHFQAPLWMHDPGEAGLRGSLLIAPYGKGYYIYTGLSFFRQLPAGVPGAYKLFANLLSINQKEER